MDMEHILAGYEYITFPTVQVRERNEIGKKIYSPNRLFYYIHKYRGFRVDDKIVGGHLAIYDAKTDERLAEYQAKDAVSAVDVAGWAWDSSGVYFRVSGGGYPSILTGEIGGINKLEVP